MAGHVVKAAWSHTPIPNVSVSELSGGDSHPSLPASSVFHVCERFGFQARQSWLAAQTAQTQFHLAGAPSQSPRWVARLPATRHDMTSHATPDARGWTDAIRPGCLSDCGDGLTCDDRLQVGANGVMVEFISSISPMKINKRTSLPRRQQLVLICADFGTRGSRIQKTNVCRMIWPSPWSLWIKSTNTQRIFVNIPFMELHADSHLTN